MEKSPEAFRTISEAADAVGVPTHVLRFWESRFPQISPVKRAGGRRYYRPADVDLLTEIRKLLHDDGMTIRGVRKMLSEAGGKAKLMQAGPKTTASLPEDLPHEADEAPMAVDVEQMQEAPRVLNFSRGPPALILDDDEAQSDELPLEAEAGEPLVPQTVVAPSAPVEPSPVVFGEKTTRQPYKLRRDADWSKVAELVNRLEAVAERTGHKS
jgi:DNA-binding transcriptional MerR regulator